MNEAYYTHALWHVKEGEAAEFIAAWEDFGKALSLVPDSPPVKGTLIQSLSNPDIFYSFGPWESLEHIEAMRSDPGVQAALMKISGHCRQASPGNYKTVLQLSFPSNTI
jgi:hypothetical protein